MARKKTDAQLRREIETTLYWPGGSGGGGRRRGSSKAGAVVRPHARTSERCTRCSQYHTTAEHGRHGRGGATPRVKAKPGPKAKPRKVTRREARPPVKTRGPLSDAKKVDLVLRAVRGAPERDRHDRGVYVSSVWSRVGKRIGMTLEEFKRWLVRKNAEQALTLLRVDLVDTADPEKLDKSYISDLGAVFDLIKDDHRRDRF